MFDEENHKKFLYPDWAVTELIELDDICISKVTGLDFLCSKIIPYKQFEYLYLGSFDFKKVLFAIQCKVDNVNYAKILTEKPQQDFAYQLYKNERQK